ncbi:16S rRNA processing protein RimM [Erythrobacter sp. HI0063]|mgnify:FL=1|jgi:16S rRNA processing protein RimM|uniref:ribosome maturation factor RimM n=1 Tax=Erythrobacter sp. HI0063 TaxID=1822240 RepID=UPI0007C40B5E|nr:ribosome maturation factor RimM [Erythrobacter sp. HI0063]KZY57716.1 16S rRNA processing protein RimM [Erythrobacter sp. HI0063]
MSHEPITLAAITGAHGVAGEVRLKLLGDGLESLKSHKHYNDGALTLQKIRSDNRGGAIARFAGIDNRTAAEKLRGTTLSVSRNDLPPLEDGEFYHSDLIGLAVVTDSGEPVGEVRAIENFGATDIVEIEKPDGKSFMIPLTEQAVPEWNAERLVMSADFLD